MTEMVENFEAVKEVGDGREVEVLRRDEECWDGGRSARKVSRSVWKEHSNPGRAGRSVWEGR